MRKRGFQGMTTQARSDEARAPISVPQTRDQTPKPATAKAIEAMPLTTAWPTSGISLRRKSRLRRSSTRWIDPRAWIRKVNESTRRMGTTSGSRKNAATAGAARKVPAVSRTLTPRLRT